jgi:hypothetical protein
MSNFSMGYKQTESEFSLNSLQFDLLAYGNKFRRFVIDKLFPAWKVQTIGEWYWVKVTGKGEPVWQIDSSHRRCYEG